MKHHRRQWIGLGILILAGLLIFQAQTFYGKRRTGFYKTNEDGASFGYYVPRNLEEDKTYPLMVIFGKKATDVMKWKELANKQGIVTVAIQPREGGDWNYSWDADRALKKINEMTSWYPIDMKKVWAVGYQRGGSFGLAMAVNFPDVFGAAAGVDAKTANTKFRAGRSDDVNRWIDIFDYSRDKDRQARLWLLNFTDSEYANKEDVADTRDILDKYGYSAAYQIIEGEPFSLTSKLVAEIYAWLNQ